MTSQTTADAPEDIQSWSRVKIPRRQAARDRLHKVPWQFVVPSLGIIAVLIFILVTAHNGLVADPRIARAGVTKTGIGKPLWGVSDWPDVFTRLFIVVAVAMAGILAITSWRNRKVSSKLVLLAATAGLCWLDPFGNWAAFAVYDPRFTHFPTQWPYLSMAPSIEPLLMIPGYAFYWFPPALFAAWVYRRFLRPRSSAEGPVIRHPLVTMFVLGLVVGFIFDTAFELFMIRANMYNYSQFWGPTIAWSWIRLPFSVIAVDALVFATLTTLMWEDDDGRSVSQRLIRRTRSFSHHPLLGSGVVSWAILSVVFILLLTPLAVVRITDNATQVNAPWRYPATKVYDPNGFWSKSDQPGPYYAGVLSVGGIDRLKAGILKP